MWIATDENGEVYAFSVKPYRMYDPCLNGVWYSDGGWSGLAYRYKDRFPKNFKIPAWEDEPVEIK